MAKKAKDGGVVDIFSVLADQDEGNEGENEGKGGQNTTDPALLGKIGALEAQLAAIQRTNTALMSQQGSYTPAPTGKGELDLAAEPDFSNLPDPVTDADAYHKEVTKRIAGHLRAQLAQDNAARQAQQEAQASRDTQVNALWAEFEEKYPNLAEHRDLVEVAAISVANKARAKGVDVQRYMFAASDQYIEDVASEVKKKYGKAIEVMGKGDGEGEGEDEAPEGTTMTEALTTARTRGISGGLPTSGKPSKGAGEGAGERDDLVSDLHKVQRSMGII